MLLTFLSTFKTKLGLISYVNKILYFDFEVLLYGCLVSYYGLVSFCLNPRFDSHFVFLLLFSDNRELSFKDSSLQDVLRNTCLR